MGSSSVSNQGLCEQCFWGGQVAVWCLAAPEHTCVASLSFLAVGAGHLKCHYADPSDDS